MITDHDHLEIRCPLLGHQLNFSYCRSTNLSQPCRKILDCWFVRFQVQEFVETHFPKGTLEDIAAPPKPKMLSIFEIMQKAQAGQRDVSANDEKAE